MIPVSFCNSFIAMPAYTCSYSSYLATHYYPVQIFSGIEVHVAMCADQKIIPACEFVGLVYIQYVHEWKNAAV